MFQLMSMKPHGIDFCGPFPEIITDNNVVVPISDTEHTQDQIHYLQQNVDPLQEDGSNGVDHYMKALDILEHFFQL